LWRNRSWGSGPERALEGRWQARQRTPRAENAFRNLCRLLRPAHDASTLLRHNPNASVQAEHQPRTMFTSGPGEVEVNSRWARPHDHAR
jgi:hypothetical protein